MCERFDGFDRSEALDVHANGSTTGECNDRIAPAVREVEREVPPITLEHRLAVRSIRETYGRRGAGETIGKHTSKSGASGNVTVPVPLEAKLLRPGEFISGEPLPVAREGVRAHIQVDEPHIKPGMYPANEQARGHGARPANPEGARAVVLA